MAVGAALALIERKRVRAITGMPYTSSMKTHTLMRLAGLSAVAAGLCFVIVGLFHPINAPESVITATWINVHIAAVLLCFFGTFGITGLYLRQAQESGWLGLIGYALFCIWFAAVMCFSLVEAFILPTLATEAPRFVEGFLGMFSGAASAVDLSVLPLIWAISGPAYILGQLLFGIATFRARVFPRYAGILLAVAAVLTPMGGLVPPEHQPLVMVPVGIAFAWLGYALWSERVRSGLL